MKPIIKKIILTGQLITLAIYIIIYLIGTFCLWKFTNPFQWLINIPYYSNDSRLGILFGFVTYYTMLYCSVAGHYFQKEKEQKEVEKLNLKDEEYREFVLFLQLRGFKYTSGKWNAPMILDEFDSHKLIDFYKKDTNLI